MPFWKHRCFVTVSFVNTQVRVHSREKLCVGLKLNILKFLLDLNLE